MGTGRPVDIEIVPRAHALLSASSADRWLVCTPSARMEEALEDEHSSYAGDGTAAHAFAELRLHWLLGRITKDEWLAGYAATKMLYAEHVKEWVVSDWEAINSYVRYVLDEAKRLDATIHIEQRVDYSKYAEGGFGTSDALLVSETQGVIKSIDLKFGKGVPVDAENNAQAKLYALGGLIKFDPDAKGLFPNVEWTIHQPRLDSVTSDSLTSAELVEWAETVVRPAAELAWKGEGELVPTPKGCRFCKAGATCRARIAENMLIARREFMIDNEHDPRLEERLMSMDEVARILPDVDGIIQWCNQLKEYALKAARDEGQAIPGYKVVRGRTTRRWAKPEEEVAAVLEGAGVDEKVIYTEPSIRSVAQMEKAMGKSPFNAAAALHDLVGQTTGTPALVQDSDPRPAINAEAEARKEFGIDLP